ncbi:Proteinase inhibitor propeptide [Penicillium brevicompactum]|uniref:Proteinase inhibitor propeptide n=1 Tax=Penicillium brevicompactum TaxID=5074 RepID=A0A9W9R7L7_PENBR|nr:Proteinase inhibitor propeptide [Penicillium brevicompactum]
MKTFIALMALPLALAASLKSVVITFPKGTPDSVITQAKHSLVASGGVITHEYSKFPLPSPMNIGHWTLDTYNMWSLINSSGFAAEAPDSALQTLSTQDAKYQPEIEEDKIVNANGEYAAAF